MKLSSRIFLSEDEMAAKTPQERLSTETLRIWRVINGAYEFEYEEMPILKIALQH